MEPDSERLATRPSSLLFLHGLTVDGRDGAVLERALPEMRVDSPNLPGHAGSPPASDWHPRALARALALIDPTIVVGHSWGAAIAVWLAALQPERVIKLVLLEGGWFDRRDLPRRAPPRDAHQAAALEALFASRSSEAWPALAKVPVLAIAGTLGDDGTKAKLLARFAERVPHARTAVLADVGHDLLRDDPERTASLIASWLRLEIAPATAGAELEAVRALCREYAASIGFSLDFQGFERELAELPGRYAPPRGRLLLARIGGAIAGCVALRPLADDVCEMKRLFVRSEFHRHGVGRALASAIVAEGRAAGYATMKLDTVPAMTPAIALYASLGFRDTEPYTENPIAGARFMELRLR